MTRLWSVREKRGKKRENCYNTRCASCQIGKKEIPKNPENTPRYDPNMFLIKISELSLASRQGTINRVWIQDFSPLCTHMLAVSSHWKNEFPPLDFGFSHAICLNNGMYKETSLSVSSLALKKPCMFPLFFLRLSHHLKQICLS